MKVKQASYVITAVGPAQYPKHQRPEIAFVGRSNVGKSSLINALTKQKGLARVAATPGKTRQIIFFDLDQILYFADLPGYGYAKVSKAEKESWGEMIETYLHTREQLKLILMLVDIRHAPSVEDRTMLDWIRAENRPFLVIASKSDKVSRNQLPGRLKEIRSVLELGNGEDLIPYSAETGQGVPEIWTLIRENTALS